MDKDFFEFEEGMELGGLGEEVGLEELGLTEEIEEAEEGEQFLGGLLSKVAPMAMQALGGLFGGSGDEEFELEAEEGLGETDALEIADAALMEHLADSAAETDNEEEAEAFIGALVPLAAKILPQVVPAISKILPKVMPVLNKAMPKMVQGLSKVTKVLRRRPASRKLIKTLPTVVRKTMGSIAKQVASGKPVTPKSVVRTLANQTASILKNPKQAATVLRKGAVLRRRLVIPATLI